MLFSIRFPALFYFVIIYKDTFDFSPQKFTVLPGVWNHSYVSVQLHLIAVAFGEQDVVSGKYRQCSLFMLRGYGAGTA